MGLGSFIWYGGATGAAVLYAKDLESVTQIWVAQGTSRLLLKEYPKVVNMSGANFQFALASSTAQYTLAQQALPFFDSVTRFFNNDSLTHTISVIGATTLVTTTITEQNSTVQNDVLTVTSGYIPQGIYIPQLGTESSISGFSTVLRASGSGQNFLRAAIAFGLNNNNYDGLFSTSFIGSSANFYTGSFVENSGYPSPVSIYGTEPTGLIENQTQRSFAMGTFPGINRLTLQEKSNLLLTNGAITGQILDQNTQLSTSTGNIPMHFRPVGMLNKDRLLTKVWVPYLTSDGSFLIDEFSISNRNTLIATITSAFSISNVADIDAGLRQFLLDRTPQSVPLAPHLVSRGVSYYGNTGAVILTEGVNISAETGFEDVSVGVFNPAEVIPNTYSRTVTVSKPKITAAEATRVLASSAYV